MGRYDRLGQPPPRRLDCCTNARRLANLEARVPGLGRRHGSADRESIATRLGWLDVGQTMRPHVERSRARPAITRKASTRSTCSAWAAAASAPKCCARSSVSRPVPSCSSSTRPTSARSRGRRPSGPGRDAVPRRQQERRHGRSGVARALLLGAACRALRGRRGPALHRDHRPGTALEAGRIAAIATCSSTRRYRRPLLGAVALRPRAGGAHRRAVADAARGRRGDGRGLPAGEPRQRRARARRVHRRGRARRPRQADGRASTIARVARLCGSSSSSPRAPASTAKARCRSSTSRSAGPTNTADRAFVAIATTRRAGQGRAVGARGGRSPGSRPDDAARRARRRVLPVGVRHGRRRRGAGHQSVRRTERREAKDKTKATS